MVHSILRGAKVQAFARTLIGFRGDARTAALCEVFHATAFR